MDRVARITILKDASSTAIYGSKAANGVVVVKTKKPEAGRLKFNYNGNFGIEWADLTDYNLMNSSEKLEYERLAGYYGSLDSNGNIIDEYYRSLYNQRLLGSKQGIDSYWLNEPLQTGFTQSHNIFAEGGDAAFRYGIGMTYTQTNGVMKNSSRDILNGNVQLTYRIDKFAFTNQTNITNTDVENPTVSFSKFAQTNPFYDKYNEYGEVEQVMEKIIPATSGTQYITNPLWDFNQSSYDKSNQLTFVNKNYFRMYHKLSGMTGTAETEAGEFWDIYKLDVVVIPTNRPIARIDMNDRVYKTKREKYKAVIEEIEKMVQAGRPVLVGTTSVEISEMLSKMLTLRKIQHNVLNAKLHQKEADIVAKAGQSSTVTIATNMAGRGTDIKLSPEVKAAGGLAIIGTERHESRRVDRQLRGRAGRQGDPGSSVFFVSLEDDLMRLFASDRLANWMDKMGFKEGEMIEHSMISKSIERAQKKVEENNFGIRKRLLEYDDVMNKQRTVVYTKRRHALMGERIGMDIVDMIWDRCVNAVEQPDYEDVKMEILQTLAMETPFSEEDFRNKKKEDLAEQTFQEAMTLFKRKTERMAAIANPVIKQVYEAQGHMYENIMIPITDGKRMYNISVNLKEAYETESKAIVKAFEKAILLHTIDDAWKENLRELDELKHSVQNASYEQKDPLLIFKLESVTLFDNMVGKINNNTISILMRGQIPVQEPQQVREAAPEPERPRQQYREEKQDLNDPDQQAAAGRDTREAKQEPYRAEKTVGRNDPCPCGSGLKYKNCHGRDKV